MAMSRTEPVSLDGIRAALRVAAEKFLRAVAKDHPSETLDRKSTRLNSSHSQISYAVFCLKKKIVMTKLATPMVISALSARPLPTFGTTLVPAISREALLKQPSSKTPLQTLTWTVSSHSN